VKTGEQRPIPQSATATAKGVDPIPLPSVEKTQSRWYLIRLSSTDAGVRGMGQPLLTSNKVWGRMTSLGSFASISRSAQSKPLLRDPLANQAGDDRFAGEGNSVYISGEKEIARLGRKTISFKCNSRPPPN